MLCRARHRVHAASHAQHITHCKLFEVLAGLCGRFFRKNINQPFIQAQNALGISDAHCCGRICLCMGLQAMAQTGRKRLPPALGADFSMAHDHEAMHFRIAALQGVNVIHNRLAADSDGFRRHTLKFFLIARLRKTAPVLSLCVHPKTPNRVCRDS